MLEAVGPSDYVTGLTLLENLAAEGEQTDVGAIANQR